MPKALLSTRNLKRRSGVREVLYVNEIVGSSKVAN